MSLLHFYASQKKLTLINQTSNTYPQNVNFVLLLYFLYACAILTIVMYESMKIGDHAHSSNYS